MIVAHHVGEHLIPAVVAAGATAGPALLVVMRARLGRLGGRLGSFKERVNQAEKTT